MQLVEISKDTNTLSLGIIIPKSLKSIISIKYNTLNN
jgi:hypothetical protein